MTRLLPQRFAGCLILRRIELCTWALGVGATYFSPSELSKDWRAFCITTSTRTRRHFPISPIKHKRTKHPIFDYEGIADATITLSHSHMIHSNGFCFYPMEVSSTEQESIVGRGKFLRQNPPRNRGSDR